MRIGEVFAKTQLAMIESIAPGCTMDELVDSLLGP